MNERIKELYNQSGGLVRMYDGKLTYFPAYQKNVGNGNFEFSSFDPEKFAELIVRECACIADDMKTIETARAIKEHFGFGMSTEDKKTLIKELLGLKNEKQTG